MPDLIHLNRFQKKILVVFSDLVFLNRALDELAEYRNQDNIDKLAEHLKCFDESVERLHDTLSKLLNEIVGVDDNEIDVQVTDKGNLL